MRSLIDEDLVVECVAIPKRMSIDDFLLTITMNKDIKVASELDDKDFWSHLGPNEVQFALVILRKTKVKFFYHLKKD